MEMEQGKASLFKQSNMQNLIKKQIDYDYTLNQNQERILLTQKFTHI